MRIGEVFQPHVGDPAIEEARHKPLFRIATNLQQPEVTLFIRVPASLGIQEVTLGHFIWSISPPETIRSVPHIIVW